MNKTGNSDHHRAGHAGHWSRFTGPFLFLAGVISLILAVAGIFLPMLPTTPFLLLAAALFMRSSKRAYNWLINHKYLGPYIQNYRLYKAIPLKTKIITLLFLWATLGCTIIFAVQKILIRIILILIGLGVTLHLTTMKTLFPNPTEKNQNQDK